MAWLPKGNLIKESKSPLGTYGVKLYRVDGGATVADSIRGELIFNKSKKKSKNIYWNYREEKGDIIWEDDSIVIINGIKLELPNGYYDFRRNRKDLENETRRKKL